MNKTYFAVTGRILFDDEDCCYLYEGYSASDAIKHFKERILADADDTDETEVIISFVLTSKTPIDIYCSPQ